MKALLDTHTFLWFLDAERRLSMRANETIRDPRDDILLSVASACEIAIKSQLRKFQRATVPVREYAPAKMAENRIAPLNVLIRHALRVADLPLRRRDPFDGLPVAQAQVEGIAIITSDPALASCDVQVLW